MIVLFWSFVMVLSLVLTSSQAMLSSSASLPDYSQRLTTDTLSEGGTDRIISSSLLSTTIDEDIDTNYAQPALKHRDEEQTVYIIDFETESDSNDGSHQKHGGKVMADDRSNDQSPLDPWSIIWYIGSFGGLVAFFLIVSFSEWCCRRGARPLSIPYTQRGEVIGPCVQPTAEPTPPPPYHLFAPPPYDSINYADFGDKSCEKLDIFVISLPIQQDQELPSQQQPPA